jgi:acetoacetyl-CoA synthetase
MSCAPGFRACSRPCSGSASGQGDRVAGMLPNLPETVAMMLAASSIGAVWSSCSPDFGPRGVLDRFSQIAPKLFVTVDGYHYNGKLIDIGDTTAEVAAALAPARTLVIDLLGRAAQHAARIPGALTMEAFLAPYAAGPVRFTRLPSSATRCSSCFRPAPPASQNASSMAPAARCCSI